jgi:hypothetical protein
VAVKIEDGQVRGIAVIKTPCSDALEQKIFVDHGHSLLAPVRSFFMVTLFAIRYFCLRTGGHSRARRGAIVPIDDGFSAFSGI